jgi:hypothetical protein|tara:strand:- start:950 stop:1129 length:180 start_codon:yes stop_codon:yes gene_type:complete
MTASTNRLTGGQVISRILKNYGIETTFCLAGASVALSHKGFLYMGTFFGDRLSRVQLEE